MKMANKSLNIIKYQIKKMFLLKRFLLMKYIYGNIVAF